MMEQSPSPSAPIGLSGEGLSAEGKRDFARVEQHAFDLESSVKGSVERSVAVFVVVDDGVAPASQVTPDLVEEPCFGKESQPSESSLRVQSQLFVQQDLVQDPDPSRGDFAAEFAIDEKLILRAQGGPATHDSFIGLKHFALGKRCGQFSRAVLATSHEHYPRGGSVESIDGENVGPEMISHDSDQGVSVIGTARAMDNHSRGLVDGEPMIGLSYDGWDLHAR